MYKARDLAHLAVAERNEWLLMHEKLNDEEKVAKSILRPKTGKRGRTCGKAQYLSGLNDKYMVLEALLIKLFRRSVLDTRLFNRVKDGGAAG